MGVGEELENMAERRRLDSFFPESDMMGDAKRKRRKKAKYDERESGGEKCVKTRRLGFFPGLTITGQREKANGTPSRLGSEECGRLDN